MSYFRHGLGAEPAPQNCPLGFVVAEGQCVLAPAAGIPSEMVGRPPGNYIWQSGNPGNWRRAKAGEVGVLPTGIQVRVSIAPGVTQTYQEQSGKLVDTGVRLDNIMLECQAAGVPTELAQACHAARKAGFAYDVEWTRCKGTGMPPELIPACVDLRKQDLTPQQVVDELQKMQASGQPVPGAIPGQPVPEETAPPSPGLFSGRNLLILGGFAALGLVIYLRRRK